MNNKKIIRMGSKRIGQGEATYIVFEAGPTHDGLETAKKLVDVAVSAGADAIKFQIIDAEKIVPDPDVMFSYKRLVSTETGETEDVIESLQEILKRRELSLDEWSDLISYCNKNNITFFSTVSNEKEIEFLVAHKVQMVKICSGDVNYHHLLRKVAEYDWVIQLDTGASSLGDIETAVNVLENRGVDNIIINHCPSGYPARLESINLRVITTLQNMFSHPVAFSDHSYGQDMDIAAVTLGANIIEKTICLDRTVRSPEYIMSLEPDDSKQFINAIRELEIAFGNSRRIVSEGESMNTINARRSLFSSKVIKKGEILTQDMIEYCRPGNGIPADMDHLVLGREVKDDITADT
ncbi:MAG: N-acetylneuraminate synthase, partial [Bacteroidetes bacterium]|nr:N-acetylneuraminate synthase [Bacteroidota bacterium]